MILFLYLIELYQILQWDVSLHVVVKLDLF